MACPQEYHKAVKRWIPAPVAVSGLIALVVLVASSSQAQTTATHASASSSSASGSHASTSFHQAPGTVRSTVPHPHHADSAREPRRYPYGGIYAVGVAVPYAADSSNDAQNDADANYQGGPTIFDRRGSGAQSYIPPVANVPDPHSRQSAPSDPPESQAPQELTVLVFKDGRQQEVGNYAIVGRNLYDMSPEHPHKVPLSDLDLSATQQQNEQRGVRFQVPPKAQPN